MPAPEAGPVRLGALLQPFGLTVTASPYLPRGTIAYVRGSEVIGWTTAERAKFLGLFGFSECAKGCTGIIMPEADMDDLFDAEAAHRAARDGGAGGGGEHG